MKLNIFLFLAGQEQLTNQQIHDLENLLNKCELERLEKELIFNNNEIDDKTFKRTPFTSEGIRFKKGGPSFVNEGIRYRRSPSAFQHEGIRFLTSPWVSSNKGTRNWINFNWNPFDNWFKRNPFEVEGIRYKKEKNPLSLFENEGIRYKRSVFEREGIRYKKSPFNSGEGIRYKKGPSFADEGIRYKKQFNDQINDFNVINEYDNGADDEMINKKSLFNGEGIRYKKSPFKDEGIRFKKSENQQNIKDNNDSNTNKNNEVTTGTIQGEVNQM